jgi:hypothetical protein
MLITGVESGELDGYLFIQEQNGYAESSKTNMIKKNWVLLDIQSTVDVFCNSELLTNICETSGNLTIHYNAGTASTNMIGDLH